MALNSSIISAVAFGSAGLISVTASPFEAAVRKSCVDIVDGKRGTLTGGVTTAKVNYNVVVFGSQAQSVCPDGHAMELDRSVSSAAEVRQRFISKDGEVRSCSDITLKAKFLQADISRW